MIRKQVLLALIVACTLSFSVVGLAANTVKTMQLKTPIAQPASCVNQTLYIKVLNKTPAVQFVLLNTTSINTNVAKQMQGSMRPQDPSLDTISTYKLTFLDPTTNLTSFVSAYPALQQITSEITASCGCQDGECASGIQVVGFHYDSSGEGTQQNPYVISYTQ